MRIDTTKRISGHDLESPIEQFLDPFPCLFTLKQSVKQVLKEIRTKKNRALFEYFYIVDEENKLQGILTLRDLLYSSPETLLEDLVDTEVIKLQAADSLEKGLKQLAHYQLLILPVVDSEGLFLGVLEVSPKKQESHPHTSKFNQRHLKEDLFQFIGFSLEQKKWSSPFKEYRLRMPWLLCNLVGGLICAVIAEFYKTTLVEIVLLAFFIPLVLTLSESIGIQSMTLSLRFLHVRKIKWAQVGKRLFEEAKSSLLLGITSALIITAFYFAWSVELMPILGIAVSVIAAMMASAFFGATFPIILHAMKLDPKVAAGPVVLMIADILTITIYLTLCTMILRL